VLTAVQGLSDDFLGRWLRAAGVRERVLVCTKVTGPAAMPWLRDGPVRLDGPNIRAAVEASLRRLRTDRVDLLQLHWPDRCGAARPPHRALSVRAATCPCLGTRRSTRRLTMQTGSPWRRSWPR
jgi:aryl-alcohol dehydrogenase-like predicted oxidoreductase